MHARARRLGPRTSMRTWAFPAATSHGFRQARPRSIHGQIQLRGLQEKVVLFFLGVRMRSTMRDRSRNFRIGIVLALLLPQERRTGQEERSQRGPEPSSQCSVKVGNQKIRSTKKSRERKNGKKKEKNEVYFLLHSRATPIITATAGNTTSGIGNQSAQE